MRIIIIKNHSFNLISKRNPIKTINAPIALTMEDFSTPMTAPVKTTLEREISIPARIKTKPANLF